MTMIATMRRRFTELTFPGSAEYWERRYRKGGDSGWGSAGALADYKAQFVNDYVESHRINSVIEFGCGDGRQLSLARYPQYVGVDVSRTVVDLCARRFVQDQTKSFVVAPYAGPQAELSLSLDVIYHLVEDDTFSRYMAQLFSSATRAVIIYSSNSDVLADIHVRHRAFTTWIDQHIQGWQGVRFENRLDHHWLDARLRPDFWVYERRG
jgi:SAM-dependent methyltransferase